MGIALAALLGQIGLPGGGFGHGYGVDGRRRRRRACRYPLPTLRAGPQPGARPTSRSRRSPTLLENPGGTLDYDGQRAAPPRHPPRVLGRRQPVPPPPGPQPPAPRARAARHRRRARAVLDGDGPPRRHRAADARRRSSATTSAPAAQRRLRDRHAARARPVRRGPRRLRDRSPSWRSGSTCGTSSPRAAPRATGSSTSTSEFRERVGERGTSTCPPFDDFWADGRGRGCPPTSDDHTLFDRFRADPDGRRLGTPSGRIELFSETIDGFGYDDCPGHPAWLEPEEWLGGAAGRAVPAAPHRQPAVDAPAQPARRRRAQPGVEGRGPRADPHPPRRRRRARHRATATSCACSTTAAPASPARSSPTRCARQAVNLSTGAWYDPVDPSQPDSPCAHGNPNVLTADRGTSRLRRARPASTCSSRSSASRATRRRCAPTAHPASCRR